MDKIDTQSHEPKKGRGRPPLSPEEKELRRIAKNKRTNEYHKQSGYAAQRKYDSANPEKIAEIRDSYYSPKIYIDRDFEEKFNQLFKDSKLKSMSEFFINAVEEKYDVVLSNRVDI